MVKNPPANGGDTRDMGSIPRSGRSPGGGHDNPLQYSCLGNPMDREAWWAIVHGVSKSQTRLSTHTHTHTHTHTEPMDCTTPSVNSNRNSGLWVMIMHQWHSTLVEDIGNGAGHACMRARDMLELSAPPSQLCCKSKTDLKQLSLKKKKEELKFS